MGARWDGEAWVVLVDDSGNDTLPILRALPPTFRALPPRMASLALRRQI
jgi:hypothetical protein